MQKAHKAFQTIIYDIQMDVQTFYDDLVRHAQNMAVWAAYMAAVGIKVESNTEADQEEPIKDEKAPQEVKEQSDLDDAESIQIDRDEYIAVDIYNNDYYTHDDEEEHMFALTEHQGD
ncbi:hypothetical protein C0992_003345 [Termitomyces sp. T32_za158]|nr:hypothetical protein C0992_003345 [Termitomyces sp. T32_za158]